MKSNVALQTTSHPVLELLSGSERGRHYEMGGERLSLGRSENNDIVIKSDAASRYHAILEKSPDGSFWIRDNQSKNGVQVNGRGVTEEKLKNGDTLQVGGLIFRFNLISSEEPSSQRGISLVDRSLEYSDLPAATRSQGRSPRSKRPLIYGILILVLGGVYFLNQTPPTKSNSAEEKAKATSEKEAPLVEPKFENPSQGKPIPGLEDPIAKTEEDALKAELANNPTKEAEQYFRRGQREYLNKNYHRAIESFRAALSLQRNHELSDYYLRLALYEVENEAKQNMEIAKKYFQSMQYSRAMFHFNEAINLMQHRPKDKLIPEAEKFIEQCRRRLQAAEQLP